MIRDRPDEPARPDPVASEMTPQARKKALRAACLARRDALTAEERIAASLAMAERGAAALEVSPGTCVSGFFPIRSEPDVRPLMAALREAGARLCLPVVIDATTIVFRELVAGAALVETGFGTRGPGPEAAAIDPDIVLMPLSAFDAAGNRIGYGAGHYDRAIARLRAAGRHPRLVGVAFELQRVDAIPAEAHDIPMHAILTERGLVAAG